VASDDATCTSTATFGLFYAEVASDDATCTSTATFELCSRRRLGGSASSADLMPTRTYCEAVGSISEKNTCVAKSPVETISVENSPVEAHVYDVRRDLGVALINRQKRELEDFEFKVEAVFVDERRPELLRHTKESQLPPKGHISTAIDKRNLQKE
jgi:hypothetical protein